LCALPIKKITAQFNGWSQQENTTVDAIYPEDPSFVAEINGTVIGAVVIHKRDEARWDIKLLYVSGGHRLSGYGRALINAVCDFVGPGVELHVKATIGGQGVFQKFGFQAGNEFLNWKYLGRVLINAPHPMSAIGKNGHRADTSAGR